MLLQTKFKHKHKARPCVCVRVCAFMCLCVCVGMLVIVPFVSLCNPCCKSHNSTWSMGVSVLLMTYVPVLV